MVVFPITHAGRRVHDALARSGLAFGGGSRNQMSRTNPSRSTGEVSVISRPNAGGGGGQDYSS